MSIITFQRGDRTALTKNFNRSEFQCSCGCGQQSVDMELAEKLQLLRDKVDRPLKITSGYRCITHNAAVGGSQNSKHRYGMAADWRTENRSINPGASLLRPWGSAASVSTGTAVGPLSTPTPVARKQRGSAPRRESTPARLTTSSCFPPSAGDAPGLQTAAPPSCSRSS